MDWELIFWCVVGLGCLALFISAAIAGPEPAISQEHLARINNGGRHL
jgi:hypothetical protein